MRVLPRHILVMAPQELPAWAIALFAARLPHSDPRRLLVVTSATGIRLSSQIPCLLALCGCHVSSSVTCNFTSPHFQISCLKTTTQLSLYDLPLSHHTRSKQPCVVFIYPSVHPSSRFGGAANGHSSFTHSKPDTSSPGTISSDLKSYPRQGG